MPALSIQSQVKLLDANLLIDIKGAANDPVKLPAELVADTQQPGMPLNSSQYWTQEPSTTHAGWFTLQSYLKDKDTGCPLVINIKGAANDPVELPAELDVSPPTGNLNQLWRWVGLVGYSFIQSYLKEKKTGHHLVIDIKGVTTPTVTAKQFSLDVWRQKKTDNWNQMWLLV